MLELVTNGLELKGKLIGFDPGSTNMYMKFANNMTVEVENPPADLLIYMRTIGLHKLQNAKIDLTGPKFKIEFVDSGIQQRADQEENKGADKPTD